MICSILQQELSLVCVPTCKHSKEEMALPMSVWHSWCSIRLCFLIACASMKNPYQIPWSVLMETWISIWIFSPKRLMLCPFMIQRHHHHSRFEEKLRRCFLLRIKEHPTSHPTMEPRLHMWMILKERNAVFHLVSLHNNGHIAQFLRTLLFGMIHFQKPVIFIVQRPIGIKTLLVQLHS